MSEKEFERVSEDVVLIDGKHYRIMTDSEVVDFVWRQEHTKKEDKETEELNAVRENSNPLFF